MNKELFKDIIHEVIDSADELKAKGSEINLIEQGELIAYSEVLSMIQDAMAGYDLSDIDLDFDIDKKYLL